MSEPVVSGLFFEDPQRRNRSNLDSSLEGALAMLETGLVEKGDSGFVTFLAHHDIWEQDAVI